MFEIKFIVLMKSETSVFRDITPCSPSKSTDISEKHVTSIFRAEEYAKQETSTKQAASKASHSRRQNSS
jgi:hypothetical protein